MTARIAAVALIVPDYDVAIAFYVGVLGFELRRGTRPSAASRSGAIRSATDGT